MNRFCTVKLTSATLHWVLQRITAILLIPLSFHLITFLNLCMNATYQEALGWFNSPVNSFFLLAWLVLTFYHAALGLQVVIEDYVGNDVSQKLLINAVNVGFLGLAIISIILLYIIS